jgi:hypothetical protein
VSALNCAAKKLACAWRWPLVPLSCECSQNWIRSSPATAQPPLTIIHLHHHHQHHHHHHHQPTLTRLPFFNLHTPQSHRQQILRLNRDIARHRHDKALNEVKDLWSRDKGNRSIFGRGGKTFETATLNPGVEGTSLARVEIGSGHATLHHSLETAPPRTNTSGPSRRGH